MTIFDGHKNLLTSVVVAPPSPAASGTTLVVTSGDGARFAAVAPCNLTVSTSVVATSLVALAASSEIVRVSSVAGDTLTIVRAQEGTSARTILPGDLVSLDVTAKALTDIEGAVNLAPLKSANASDLADPEAAKWNLAVQVFAAKAAATTNLSLSGLAAVDGFTPSVTGTAGGPDVILATGQTTASQNGLWAVNAGAWTRPSRFPTGGVIARSCEVTIGGGSNPGTVWVLPVTSPVTIDTTAQSWALQPVPVGALPASVAIKSQANTFTKQQVFVPDSDVVPAIIKAGNTGGLTSTHVFQVQGQNGTLLAALQDQSAGTTRYSPAWWIYGNETGSQVSQWGFCIDNAVSPYGTHAALTKRYPDNSEIDLMFFWGFGNGTGSSSDTTVVPCVEINPVGPNAIPAASLSVSNRGTNPSIDARPLASLAGPAVTATRIVAAGTADANPAVGLFAGTSGTTNSLIASAAPPRIGLGPGGSATFDVYLARQPGGSVVAQSKQVNPPAFAATTAYEIGAPITQAGMVYTRITAGTSGASFAADAANWRLVGPVTAALSVSGDPAVHFPAWWIDTSGTSYWNALDTGGVPDTSLGRGAQAGVLAVGQSFNFVAAPNSVVAGTPVNGVGLGSVTNSVGVWANSTRQIQVYPPASGGVLSVGSLGPFGGAAQVTIGQNTATMHALAMVNYHGVSGDTCALELGDGNVYRGNITWTFTGTSGAGNTSASHQVMVAGAVTERLRLDGTGIGFYNHAAAAQQTITGSRGANAALASLLTALAATGLIVDSST